MSFLIDTDICSFHLKNHPLIANRFLQYTGRLHVSVVTVGELWTWAARVKASPKRGQGLKDLLSEMTILDVTTDVAQSFGEVRAALLDAGQSRSEMDLLIAATALVHGLHLVTHNVADYSGISGLTVLDWSIP